MRFDRKVGSTRSIVLKGAREHNLKDVDLEIPRDRLVIVSGVSGSGKSSLVFDTIFAEGQRRYVESLSAYARQFLGRAQKPKLDYIEGLSPAIAIEQKTTHRNPRSTVGTVTEVYDYLRLLYARIGKPHCPHCHREIQEQSIDQIVDNVLSLGERITILSPLAKGEKGTHQTLLDNAKKAGFVRVRVDGEVVLIEEVPLLKKNQRHTIEIVVDRIRSARTAQKRVADSIETALEVSQGSMTVLDQDSHKEHFFSEKNACLHCDFSMEELQPRLFSFNSPYGACDRCGGLGVLMNFDKEMVAPDLSLSFSQGGLAPYNPEYPWHRKRFKRIAQVLNFSLEAPLSSLSRDTRESLFEGSAPLLASPAYFPGIMEDLKRRYRETTSEGIKEDLERYMSRIECPKCQGKRLREESLSVTVGDKNIHDVAVLSVKDTRRFFENLTVSKTEKHIAQEVLKEIHDRLSFMESVGLDYLTLHRSASTLSGGEAQRLRLATQIGSSLMGVLYVLDEPTIGLHQRDNERLINTLLRLRDRGNTLLVVEHDEQMIRQADHIIDMGPGAGEHGGKVVAEGNLDAILANAASPTGRFLSGKERIEMLSRRRAAGIKKLILRGVSEHNLKNIDVTIPLELFTVITGVSGSGKSTLLNDILYPLLVSRTHKRSMKVGAYETIEGSLPTIDKVIAVDQDPIGRTPRSNPATYVGLFTPIRELFASLPESRARGYKLGRFSFNVKGGRCEHCRGGGTQKIEMHFLPDVYVTCDVCQGKRFNRETLEVRYKGKNIHEVLALSVEEAFAFFAAIPSIVRRLGTLCDVGLGYVKLGQSALTLSGGEAQRVKLALELSKINTGKTFYTIDEPTTGLHFSDTKRLIEVIQKLVEKGNTVCMIEHNMDVIKCADHILDLGPEGGDKGGYIVAEGTPEEIATNASSHTGRFLREVLSCSAS